MSGRFDPFDDDDLADGRGDFSDFDDPTGDYDGNGRDPDGTGLDGRVLYLAGALLLVVIVLLLATCQQGQQGKARGLDLDDFRWGWLIGSLASGNTEPIMGQTADGRLLSVWYMGAMVDYLSSIEPHAYRYDYRCYSIIYQPELKSYIKSVGIANIAPSIVADLWGGLAGDSSLVERFPHAAGLLARIADELPRGSVNSAIQVTDLPRLVREQATLDTYTLIHKYGCDPEGPTAAVFRNMNRLMERHSTLGYSGR